MSLLDGVSVVVPVYCSESTLGELVFQICTVLDEKLNYEIILVDDGSQDDSWSRILQLSKSNSRVFGIRLGRNVGQHGALLAGVRRSHFCYTVTLDDDLQNPPSEVPRLLGALAAGFDVVYGVSPTLQHSKWRIFSSQTVRFFFRHFLRYSEAKNISSFRAFRTELRSGFSNELGPNISLDSLLTWSTSSFTTVQVRHEKRSSGRTNYSFLKLVKHLVDSITGYSIVPLRLAIAIGSIVCLLGSLLLLWVTLVPLLTQQSVPGFPLLASSLAIFSGTQLLMLGILGEYIGKIHFRVMNKPTYLISETTES